MLITDVYNNDVALRHYYKQDLAHYDEYFIYGDYNMVRITVLPPFSRLPIRGYETTPMLHEETISNMLAYFYNRMLD